MTIILAAISILVVFGGIVAFFEVRSAAKKEARLAARKIAEDTAEVIAKKYLQAKFPIMMQEYKNLIVNIPHDDKVPGVAKVQENHEKPL